MAKGNLPGMMKLIREEPRLAVEVLELAMDHDISVHTACDAICAAYVVVQSRRLEDDPEGKIELERNPNAPPDPPLAPNICVMTVEDAKSNFRTAKAKRTRTHRKSVGHNNTI